MYTRTFERSFYDWKTGLKVWETIKISDYGYEYYHDGKLVNHGLTEDAEADIKALLEDGFTEVL